MAVVTTAVIGVAAAGYQAYQGFSEAAKQKELASKADAAAKKAMTDAKKKAETDYYEGLNVPMDAYEQEFEQNLAVQKQNVEALQEGDARALAAGVGRVGAQSQAGAENTRIAMGEEISDLNKTKADSKEAINQQLIEMDVAYAKEQNMRQRDAEAARAQAINSGVQGVAGVATGLASMAPLYSQSGADRRGSKLSKQFADQKPSGMSDAQWAAKLGEKGYSRKQYKNIKKQGSDNMFWDGEDFQYGSFGGDPGAYTGDGTWTMS